MYRIFLTSLISFMLSSCEQTSMPIAKNSSEVFEVFLRPSFDERAEIILAKIDTQQTMQFLILSRESQDKSIDTFYLKKILLSKNQYDNFDYSIIQKTKIAQPLQWNGCCDGMPVTFLLIKGMDTSGLYFRSPRIKTDSSGYEITKATIDQLGKLYGDSIITDYLHDVESYMDDSKQHTNWNENRPINRLRKAKYSR